MPDEQWVKLVNWVVFTLFVPIVVYPAALLIAGLEGKKVTLKQALDMGDLLFLVITMLAGSMDITLQAYLAPAKNAVIPHGRGRILDYICFLAALLSLLVYTLVYGRIIMGR